jgi:hypothetical protein
MSKLLNKEVCMKSLLLIVLLLFGCQSQEPVFPTHVKNDRDTIIGKWEYAQQRTDNIVVGHWVLHKDGTMESSMTIGEETYILTGVWKLNGGKLVTKWTLMLKDNKFFQTASYNRFKGLSVPSTSRILKLDTDVLILKNKTIEKFTRVE